MTKAIWNLWTKQTFTCSAIRFFFERSKFDRFKWMISDAEASRRSLRRLEDRRFSGRIDLKLVVVFKRFFYPDKQEPVLAEGWVIGKHCAQSDPQPNSLVSGLNLSRTRSVGDGQSGAVGKQMGGYEACIRWLMHRRPTITMCVPFRRWSKFRPWQTVVRSQVFDRQTLMFMTGVCWFFRVYLASTLRSAVRYWQPAARS